MSPAFVDTAARLSALAERQLFFVGGAPRSGTTWLQQMLDAHPLVCCRGEGLFLHQLAMPLQKLMADRSGVLAGKNRELFGHTGGFPLPSAGGTEHLAATAILSAFDQYQCGPEIAAIGEKTPENVFYFPRLIALFPKARCVSIARDPRDVLSSAWHFFGSRAGGTLEAFVQAALPSMAHGAKAMTAFTDAHPRISRLVTYEALRRDPIPVLADLFGLLGVPTDAAVLAAIVARTDFAVTTGRAAGVAKDGVFHRKGVVGGWQDTLNPPVERMIMDSLGWMFARFGWPVA